jgi:hypothetical protein
MNPMARPERTGKAPAASADAYSIDEFCTAHRISRGLFYKMRAAGTGPREIHAGTRVIISREAAEEWRQGTSNQS